MTQLKAKNLALFVLTFGFALIAGAVLDAHPVATVVSYGLGVWPCVFIVRMGWLE